MCGRYALHQRPSLYRQRLADQNMPVDDAPDDDDNRHQIRQTYNFAPGNHGLIYRAESQNDRSTQNSDHDASEPSPKRAKTAHTPSSQTIDGLAIKATKYKLQAAKWGLIPFWTKRPPDYGSQLRTINCRDDSLMENRGMWNTMKQRKRCIVIAEGFYEWLKKNGGREKIPHYTKRKDGQLMCFAGLYDCVRYEGSEEELWTYTIITTDSNQQLKFLHDRMPVILAAGSAEMKTWLNPNNVGWSKELQSMLKPFEGELECYPVDQGVGKVGNNSPLFVVPVDSKENKKNIANFFGAQGAKNEAGVKKEEQNTKGIEVKQEVDEHRETDPTIEGTEDNAPVPKPLSSPSEELEKVIKQEASTLDDGDTLSNAADDFADGSIEQESSIVDDEALAKAAESPVKTVKLEPQKSPERKAVPKSGRRMRSATTNNTVAKTPKKERNQTITSFFGK
jgi:putative SOS response-associated peptidase YedK